MAGKQTGSVDNWQSEKSLSECLQLALHLQILCDVTFTVGQQKKIITAHKLILSLRSSVFMAMLNGAMAEQEKINIPDIQPAIFEEFLQFLYTDQVKTNASNVTGLLYAAKKYDVKNLEQQCLKYLDASITAQNACVVMEQAHLYDEHSLKTKSFKIICENGDAALKSDAVVDMCGKCLDDVVQSDELKVSEETTFEAILTWSETACRNLRREVTPENRRQVLGDTTLHVRYPLLSQDYFVNRVTPTKLLTIEEGFKIMQHLMCPDKDVSPFNAKQRNERQKSERKMNEEQRNATSSQVTTCITRFDTLYGGWSICSDDYNHAIMFSINKNAELLGFQLYGADDNTTQRYDVTAFLTTASTDEIMEASSITTTVVAHTTTYDIMFPRAVRLNKDVKYCLIVHIKGQYTQYGESGKSVINDDAITCSFFKFNSSKHSNRPNGAHVDRGQIPGLLFLV